MTSRSLAEARRSARRPRSWAFLSALLGPAFGGCIDPKADFEDFLSRPVLVPEAGVSDAPVVDVTVTPCEDLLRQDPSGSYYVSCRPMVTGMPFGLAVDLTATANGTGGGTLRFSFRPLLTSATTLADGLGNPVVVPDTAISTDCTFIETIGTFSLPAATNPLNLDIVADQVALRGKLQTVDTSCGDLDGTVVSPPIGLPLAGNGDPCMFTRLASADAALPPVPSYSCDPSQLPAP